MTGWRIGFVLVPAPIVRRDDQAAEPLDVEPDFDRAEGGGRSAARTAGIGGASCWPSIASGAISWWRGCARFPACSATSRRARSTRIRTCRCAFGKNGITNSLQFAERLLAEAHVAVVPGEAFGTDRHIRISYATSMKELERGLDRIHQFIVKNS